ncbi:MAG: putative membrane protein [Mariniblastus sp.]|jgi:uncharacterized membrane protein
MTFMHPMLLLGALGIALPILAHLLSKHQHKQTPWAAMQFLNRAVRVRSTQLRLRDILLMILRCLAVLSLVFAISKPTVKQADGILSQVGERRAGVVIALDASYSMQHSDGKTTRFARALQRVEAITAGLHRGDPISLVLLGAEHRVVVQDMAFDPEEFNAILHAQKATPESLDLNSVPKRLSALVQSLDAVQKEVYLVTDLQEQDWQEPSAFLMESLKNLSESASVFVLPVPGDSENLAVTHLNLVSGVLRKGTVARYRATVRNLGTRPVTNVVVTGMANDIAVRTKIIPAIAAGSSETVSFFVPFNNPGSVKITAQLNDDALALDNARRTVAVIRDRVSVLCVEGASGSADRVGGFIAAALSARDDGENQEGLDVKSVPWLSLPSQNLASYDVVILADVPAITPEQASDLETYVRGGNGLIWFPGENMKSAVWNKRSKLAGTPLLPAVIEQTISTSDALGMGRLLEPLMPDHPVCRPLRSLSEDLLSETHFLKAMQVQPSASSVTVLSLAGSDSPLLIEHALGRGHVFMFTSSAEPTWNNMAITPVFPMLLQQMVTYLTAREFEKPRLVGNALALSYIDQPDASDAVFETPSGKTITVPVSKHRDQYVALLEHANEVGYYLARVSVQAPSSPIAVNVDTRESNVKCLPTSELASIFNGTGLIVAHSETELLDAIAETRTGMSFWRFFMFAGLALLLIESLLVNRLFGKSSKMNSSPVDATAQTEMA